jgi:hypothetical protein
MINIQMVQNDNTSKNIDVRIIWRMLRRLVCWMKLTEQTQLLFIQFYFDNKTFGSSPFKPSGHYMYRQFTAQWSLYVPPVYSPLVTICTASLQPTGHYMYRQFNI